MRVLAASDQNPAPAEHIQAPRNVIPVYVNSVPARCLVDSGASHCICSGDFYRKVLTRKSEGNAETLVARKEKRELLTANNSRMAVLNSFDAEIKINGLTIPITFDVIEVWVMIVSSG